MRHWTIFALSIVVLACTTSSNTQTATNSQSGITVPKVIHRVDPELPAELRRDGISGVVTVSATIDKNGQVVNPQILRSTNHRLDEFALDAIRQWKFKPGTMNGVPVDVHYVGEVKFSAR